MRLIDADELIEFLKKVTITDGITFETGFKQILTDIKNQPTIEPVRGEWLKAFRYMRENIDTGKLEPVCSYDCPICNYHTGNQGAKFNFCPNCGCDMREKVEE